MSNYVIITPLVAADAEGLLHLVLTEHDLSLYFPVTTERMTARVTREPWLGPWSAGVIGTYGLGRFDAPVVGDLGLMRIVAAETGRWPEADETRALVDHYGEWSGLASAYLLMHPHARTKQGERRQPGARRRAA